MAKDSRDRLVEVAAQIAATEGPAAVTHRAVAERAGVSLGLTTYHFGSRDEIVREGTVLALEWWLGSLKEEIAALDIRSRTTHEGSILVVRALYENRHDDPEWLAALFQRMLQGSQHQAVAGAIDGVFRSLRSVVDEILRKSHLVSCLPVGDLISLADGLAMRAVATGQSKPHKEIVAGVERHLYDANSS